MFGPHLTLDLSECDLRKLSDHANVYSMLDALPDLISMHKISPPYAFVYKPKDKPEEWGVSGFVMISESHISIHTFPDKGHAFIDIFSCKQFDIHKAIAYLTRKFDSGHADKRLPGRGKDYPPVVEAERNIVTRS